MKVRRKSDSLMHHGIKGQRWGIRRYQNADGSLTDAGKKRYNKLYNSEKNFIDENKKYLQKDYDKEIAIVDRKINKAEEKGKTKKVEKLNERKEVAKKAYEKGLEAYNARKKQIDSYSLSDFIKERRTNLLFINNRPFIRSAIDFESNINRQKVSGNNNLQMQAHQTAHQNFQQQILRDQNQLNTQLHIQNYTDMVNLHNQIHMQNIINNAMMQTHHMTMNF